MSIRNPWTVAAALAGAGAGAVAAAAGAAQAHAHLLSATPAADSTVGSPEAITLHFSEKLEPQFSGVELMKANGPAMEIRSSVADSDSSTITGALKGPLAPGGYMVMWHAVSADGRRTSGDYEFTVR